MADYEVYLQGGSPWGFRLQGGKEFRVPLKISRVEPGGKADIAGIKVGDHVVEINGTSAGNLYHTEALTTVKRAGYSLSLILFKPEPSIQSQSIENLHAEPDDLGPVERERSKTLPKKLSSASSGADTHSDMINTNSLPRSGSTSKSTGPPGKAPAWYKQMYKEMHSSMEGESHLTKLLSSDAKRGAFRKYDGASTVDETGKRQSATAEDAPRRLQGGGRLVANHPHRKSLPNIHAANFNFMSLQKPSQNNTQNTQNTQKNEKKLSTTSITIRQKTPSSSTADKQENRKSVNSEWYRQLQKGGEIPESGLATVKAPPVSAKVTATSSVPTKKKEIKITPTKMASYVKASEPLNRQSKHDYNNPPDFLELRKQELKNKDVEREREQIREMRERERIAEEERLKQQREKEKLAAKEQLDREESFITPYLVQQVESAPPPSQIEKTTPTSSQREEKNKKPILTHIDISKELEELEKEIEIPLPADFGKAKYSFHPQGPEELEFKKGQVIRLLQVIDDNWLEGELNGNVGIFPLTYVEFLPKENSPKVSTESTAHVKQEKPTLYVEPIVKPVVEKVEERVEVKQESTVESMNDSQTLNDDEPTVILEPGFAKAKYTFKAESDTELPFRKGDMIKLLRRIDENWFEGELDDNIGILPVNYVDVLEEPTTKEVPKKQTQETVEEIIKPVKGHNTETSLDFNEIFAKPHTNGHRDVDVENLYNKNKSADPYYDDSQKIDDRYYDIDDRYDEKPMYNNNNYNNNIKNAKNVDSEPSLEEMAEGLVGQGEPHQAIYSYKQRNEDEVTLQKGDVVYVLEKCDDGWFVGTCERTGAFGIFPGNYVKTII